jgi:FkbM family methyltransferase
MKDFKFLFEKYVLGQHNPNKFPEPQVLRFVSRIRGSLLVDIGANVGIYTKALVKNFEQAFAFEPNPTAFRLLKENLVGLKVTLFPLALTNERGKTLLYLDPHKGFTGSADTILPIFEYRPNLKLPGGCDHTYIGKHGVEIETNTYDNVLAGRIADLVKIDVEGAEFLVLQGMMESLKSRKVKRLVVELHNRDRAGELEMMLYKCGFQTMWLDFDRIFGELEGIDDAVMPYRIV